MSKILISLFLLSVALACAEYEQAPSSEANVLSTSEYILDSERNRQIPIHEYSLSDSSLWNGKLVILNAGYGSSTTEYDYISTELAKNGYYVISIQHEIQTDELLPSGEDIIKLRTPNWKEGVKSIHQVLSYAKKNLPSISIKKIHLIGHSNGGDISVLYANLNPKKVHSLITLDHRRMPIPLTKNYKVLSIRADQFEVDEGVIPSKKDQAKYGIEIVYLKNVDHNYLRDIATQKTKEKVITEIFDHLNR